MTKMKKVKVAEATNSQLDWLVAKCEGESVVIGYDGRLRFPPAQFSDEEPFHPTTDWSLMGPIIEREYIALRCSKGQWYAMSSEDLGDSERAQWSKYTYRGQQAGRRQCRWNDYTPQVAAAKCYVVSKLGDTVEVPEGLT